MMAQVLELLMGWDTAARLVANELGIPAETLAGWVVEAQGMESEESVRWLAERMEVAALAVSKSEIVREVYLPREGANEDDAGDEAHDGDSHALERLRDEGHLTNGENQQTDDHAEDEDQDE